MWNRIILATAGVVLGWSVVGYLVVPVAQKRAQLVRLVTGGLVGVIMVVWLGTAAPEGAVAGALVFMIAALVAYAAHARQVDQRDEVSLGARPRRPEERDPRVSVLLIAPYEPPGYDGPAPWAERLRALQRRGEPVPGWFVRPWRYAAIRSAYERMGGRNPLDSCLTQLAQRMQVVLGPAYRVWHVCDLAQPGMADVLRRAAEQGAARIVLLPLSPYIDRERLGDIVTATRVREKGVEVAVVDTPHAGTLDWLDVTQRLGNLLRGEPPQAPPTPDSDQLAALCELAQTKVG